MLNPSFSWSNPIQQPPGAHAGSVAHQQWMGDGTHTGRGSGSFNRWKGLKFRRWEKGKPWENYGQIWENFWESSGKWYEILWDIKYDSSAEWDEMQCYGKTKYLSWDISCHF